MKRRKFLLAAGACAALPLALHLTRDAWDRIATTYSPTGGLTEAQLALVSAIADTLIPRTDTPSATDVGVPAWINVIVTEYYANTDRTVFVGGLAAIDALALETNGVSLSLSTPERRERVIAVLDRPNAYEQFAMRLASSRRVARAMSHFIDSDVLERIQAAPAQRARAYLQIKELVVHGYFTSEHVHNEVLKAGIMPGRFDGDAPEHVTS